MMLFGLRSRGKIGLAAIALATTATQAQAQAQGLPTREEINRLPQSEAPPPSRLTVEGGIETAPCPLADPKFADISFTLKDVVFDNLRGVEPAALRSSFADFVGKTVPIATVCQIRDAAATILRRQGFLAAVEVPPQKIEDGTLHLDVLMAKLVALHIRGNAGRSEQLIAGYLERLKNGEPFNERTAERYLLLARDLPGYDVRLVLRPAGTAPGEVVGDITVNHIPFALYANVQNLGSQAVGRWAGLLSAEAYDLLGSGDRLSVGLFNTSQWREQHVVQSAYDIRVGSNGLTLGGRFTYAWTRPHIGDGDLLRSRTLVASLEASYPFIRSQSTNLRGAIGLDVINQQLKFGPDRLTYDKLRVLYLRLDLDTLDRKSATSASGYSVSEPRWRLNASLTLRKGLDFLGASNGCGKSPDFPRCEDAPTLSRLDGKPGAFLVRLDATGEYRPVPNIAFVLSPHAQKAFNPVLSYEEYSAGNYTVGRGYDPGALVADSGIGFQSEIRFGRATPKSATAFAFQPYGFFDAAWVWNKGPVSSFHSPQSLYSAGAGMRVAYGNKARVDMIVAVPLKRAIFQEKRGDVRFLVNLTTRLLPWRSQ